IRAHLNPLPGVGPMPRFVCMILLLVATALAQDASTGAIRGSVFDSTGGRIHGASVALVNAATGIRDGVITDSECRFAFDLLPRGLTSGSDGDLAFGGIRGYQSSYLVDGGDNNNAFFSQARGRYRAPYQFSNEVVQEFRVSSNTYGAELGRAGGAVVNVVTKSGSNHLHGTAFYFLRDSSFGAQPAFLDFKPQSRQHQFGGTIGGPIRSNRVFFFAGYDQHIFHVPTVVNYLSGGTVLVPQAGTGPLRDGDFEASDRDLVFATAAQLNKLAGNFQSDLLGNTGFFKLDATLTPRQHLSARLNTSRYYGTNNVFFDPASPITNSTMSDNGEENVTTE